MIKLKILTSAPLVARILHTQVAGLKDFSKVGPNGEPSCWDRYREIMLRRGRRMYATQNSSEGIMWPQYLDTAERDAYIFAKAGITGLSVDAILTTVLMWPGVDRLFGSLTSASHPDAVYLPTKESADIGTSTPWAEANHLGLGNAPKNLGGHPIPARSLMDIGAQTSEELNAAAFEYITVRITDTTERVTAATARQMAGL